MAETQKIFTLRAIAYSKDLVQQKEERECYLSPFLNFYFLKDDQCFLRLSQSEPRTRIRENNPNTNAAAYAPMYCRSSSAR